MTLTSSDAGRTIAVGALRAVAGAGDAAPAELGGTYQRLLAAAVDDSGAVAFGARLESAASAIVLLAGGSPRVIVRSGDEAPGGGRYRSFGALDLGDGELLAFAAQLDGCPRPSGVFLWTGHDGVRALARAGDPAPAGGAYASFGQLSLTSWTAGDGPRFLLGLVARLADGRKAVVIQPSHGPALQRLTSGAALGEEVLDDVVASPVGTGGMCCVATTRGRRGRIRGGLIVTDSLVLSTGLLREGSRMPGLGRVERLLAPPAISTQLGLLTVELDGGRGALCTMPPLVGDPEVLVRTGDALPGLPGERIRRLGPPVANAGEPGGRTFGVASVARLRGGRGALWLGVFRAQVPLRGEAIVPLLCDDRSDDRDGLPVRSFTPLKLSNSGILLLRGLLGQRGRLRERLLLLDGLFDW